MTLFTKGDIVFLKASYRVLRVLILNPYLYLIFVPKIVAWIILPKEDFSLFYIVSSLYLLVTISLVVYFLKMRLFQNIFFMLLLLGGIAEILHWMILKSPIGLSALYALQGTNHEEVMEFFHTYIQFSNTLCILFYIIVAIYLWRYMPRYRLNGVGLYSMLSVSAMILSVAIGAVVGSSTNGFYYYIHPLLRVPYTYYIEQTSTKEMKQYRKRFLDRENVLPYDSDAREVYVYIIGESTSRTHMSLYGYQRDTTPQLSAMKDQLFYYTNVIAPATSTIESLTRVLTYKNNENKCSYKKVGSLIDTLRLAGYETTWISNQIPIGVWDSPIGILAKQADYSYFMNQDTDSELALNHISYDQKVVDKFSQELAQSIQKKRVFFLHLMGAHNQYKKRYPLLFSRFNSGKDDRNITIDHYDNALYYNDYIVTEVMRRTQEYWKENEGIGATLYFSDHGETLYEGIDYAGHGLSSGLGLKNILDIPLIISLSSRYKQKFPKEVERISHTTNRRFMTDDLIHSILGLMHIRTSLLDPTRDLFSQEFNNTRSRIIYDIDYDKTYLK